ncbi:hypothetical protein ACR80S_00200 [Halomonas sp. MA07-2]|uniref:hypothetical protein n=1 Tax=Halomonas sp. MA07-2 TaxID=3440841 RepID=UPI003EEB42CE
MTSDSQPRYPDIEIYLAKAPFEALGEWLGAAIDAEPLAPAGKGQWRTRGHHDGEEVPVLLVEKAADGFASLWFNSPATPWENDAACARAAATRLGCEVRCSLGSWHPGDDPDRFLRVLPDGSEAEIDWPDSGH